MLMVYMFKKQAKSVRKGRMKETDDLLYFNEQRNPTEWRRSHAK